MKAQRFRIVFGLVALCLFIVAAYLLLKPNPYRRLERMGKNALRLSWPGSQPRLSDQIIGVLHRRDPRIYYGDEAQKEQKALLASGLLVETKIAISGTRSKREVYQALSKSYQKTGAYWAATVDLTNQVVLLISKPEDVASFAVALENE